MQKNKSFQKIITYLSFLAIFSAQSILSISNSDYITIAILAKDKAHTLPLYLACVESQTWPKKQTYLYVRTNNNNDNTQQILKQWLENVADQYAGIYFDDSDLPQQIQKYQQHEWNCERFKILGKIRQDSIIWAYEHNSHYFVIDCDNFIKPHTLQKLFDINLPIVAPFILQPGIYYANFHADIDEHGYLKSCDSYYTIFNQVIKGLIQVPVVHCTYFIQHQYLPYMSYDDESYRYEYVIFSDVARKNHVSQYLDNREVYGFLTFAETQKEFDSLWWLNDVYRWFL